MHFTTSLYKHIFATGLGSQLLERLSGCGEGPIGPSPEAQPISELHWNRQRPLARERVESTRQFAHESEALTRLATFEGIARLVGALQNGAVAAVATDDNSGNLKPGRVQEIHFQDISECDQLAFVARKKNAS